MERHLKVTLWLLSFGCLACGGSEQDDEAVAMQTGRDYPAYGGNKANNRYSPLTQINAGNVNDLEIAWTYFANVPDSTNPNRSPIQCQPIVVDGILYGTSAELNLFALDAGTGEELWKFDPQPDRRHANRGVMYWENAGDKRILYAAGSFLYAVNAFTGEIIPAFGDSGRVDLHQGLSDNLDHDVNRLTVVSTSPGVICGNTVVMGSAVSEGGEAAPGHIRAFDVVSGKLKWVFHTIPHPGEEGYKTWPPEAYKKFGGSNSWGGMSADEQRNAVYFATGSPSSDFYGGDRQGANLFSNCVISLDASSGKMNWYFQAIRHDLWDRDFPCPPNLTTVNQNGKKADVVVQAGKDGFVYVLDRDKGTSLFPVEERPVPTDGVPGEHPYPVQPFVVRPLPLSKQLLTEDDLTDISPEAHDFVKKRFHEYPEMDSRFQPPSEEGTILYGYSGGAEWGGNSVDTEGILYQNANNVPWELKMVDRRTREEELITVSPGRALYLRNCSACHGEDRKGSGTVIPDVLDLEKKLSAEEIENLIVNGNGRMPAFPTLSAEHRKAIAGFLLGDERMPARENHVSESVAADAAFPYVPAYTSRIWSPFTDQNGYPAVRPPWGTLNAIDLNTGEYLWSVPLGEYPELTEKGIPVTGTESYGGPVVTGSGLIFIAGTRDERIRALDKRTGKVVWEYQLPAGGFATPVTYEVDGRQFIVIAAGGGRGLKPGGWYVAFALKKDN